MEMMKTNSANTPSRPTSRSEMYFKPGRRASQLRSIETVRESLPLRDLDCFPRNPREGKKKGHPHTQPKGAPDRGCHPQGSECDQSLLLSPVFCPWKISTPKLLLVARRLSDSIESVHYTRLDTPLRRKRTKEVWRKRATGGSKGARR